MTDVLLDVPAGWFLIWVFGLLVAAFILIGGVP